MIGENEDNNFMVCERLSGKQINNTNSSCLDSLDFFHELEQNHRLKVRLWNNYKSN